MKLIMESLTNILNIPMILVWIFGRHNLDFKFKKNGLTQVGSPNLFILFGKNFNFAQSLLNAFLELPGQICKLKNILCCQVEQCIWFGNFGKVSVPF